MLARLVTCFTSARTWPGALNRIPQQEEAEKPAAVGALGRQAEEGLGNVTEDFVTGETECKDATGSASEARPEAPHAQNAVLHNCFPSCQGSF